MLVPKYTQKKKFLEDIKMSVSSTYILVWGPSFAVGGHMWYIHGLVILREQRCSSNKSLSLSSPHICPSPQ